jgi:hypothetical protein
MCPASILRDKIAAERIRLITFEHKDAVFPDEDEYWTTKSPFDNKWYTFRASRGSEPPTKPIYITEEKPTIFD